MYRTFRWKRIVYIMLVIGNLCFIFGHSLLPAGESSGKSGLAAKLIAEMLDGIHIPLVPSEHLIRKAAHFIEFFLLGVFMTKAFESCGLKGIRGTFPLLFAFLFTAAADETIQAFVPGRSSSVTDIWLDFTGAAMGMLLCRVAGRLSAKNARGNNKA